MRWGRWSWDEFLNWSGPAMSGAVNECASDGDRATLGSSEGSASEERCEVYLEEDQEDVFFQNMWQYLARRAAKSAADVCRLGESRTLTAVSC